MCAWTFLPREDGAVDPRVVTGKGRSAIVHRRRGLDVEAVGDISARSVVVVHNIYRGTLPKMVWCHEDIFHLCINYNAPFAPVKTVPSTIVKSLLSVVVWISNPKRGTNISRSQGES